MQEVWVKAYRKIDRLRSGASERAWLASFARRTVQHYRRRAGRSARKIQAVRHHRDEATNPHLRFEERQLADAVLAQLGADQRLAYVLVHGYGMSGAEAAEALGASVNTIYSRLRLAQKKIERLCEASGVSAEALEDGARPEPNLERRSRVLALVMLQVRGAESAVLGAWVSFALGAAVLVVAAAGLTGDLSAKNRPSPVPRASPVSVLNGAPESKVDRGLVALSKTSTTGTTPLHLGEAEQPRPAIAATFVDPEPTASKQPAPPEEAATGNEGLAKGRSVGRRGERPVEAGSSSRAAEAKAASAGEKPDTPETAAAAETAEEVASPEHDGPAPAHADEQLEALADEVAAAAAARRAAWGPAVAAAPPPAQRASIAPETELLRGAKAAYNAGRPREALRMLNTYDDTFPRGRLRDVATGIRVSALCERGRTRAARKEAVALRERSPSSPINAKVRRACW